MKKLIAPILLTMAILAINSCKKDPTKNAILPEATKEGKNTVGFILIDEVWVPYGKCGSVWTGGTACGKISARYELASSYESEFSFQFRRKREKLDKSSSLTIYSQIEAKITSLGNKIDSIGVSFSDENRDDYSRLQTGSKFIITKLDTVNKVISGEFEFVLNEDTGSGKQIILKNGRFDLKMNACLCDSK